MLHLAIALPILIVLTSQEPPPPAPADRSAFEAAKAKAGINPAKLVKLALWCESRGMTTERRAALEHAVRLDPNNAAARGLLWEISYQGRWEAPEAVSRRMKEDAALTVKLAQYRALRERVERDTELERREFAAFEKAGNDAKVVERKLLLDRRIASEHVRIGLWCDKNGLKPESMAHFTTALYFHPHDQATWRHLGYVQHHGRWMSREQIAAEEHEAHAQAHADNQWQPLLHRWAARLRDQDHRAEAEENLATVSDPRAIPTIVRVFGETTPAGQEMVVRLLGQIDAPRSSRRLAALSVFSEADAVRQAAAQALKGREPRDFAEWIVNLIRTPMTYEGRPVGGLRIQGALVIDSPRFHIIRTYDAPPAFRLSSIFRGHVGFDPNGLPVVMTGWWDLKQYAYDVGAFHPKSMNLVDAATILRDADLRTDDMAAAARLKAAGARERLAEDVRELVELNAEARVLNRRAADVLRVAMDAPPDFGEEDENAWNSWFYERIGYRYKPPQMVVAVVNAVPQVPAPLLSSTCFPAGTPVRTLEGPRPIESVRTGDQVLSRDVATGALTFRPVLAVHHNPPDATLRVALDRGDAIVVSRIHRFWVAGRGWAMARDLKPGDVLRTLDGTSRITSIEQAPVQLVFNLDVAEFRTYFAGNAGILVHDNTLPPAHPSEPPFDLVSDLDDRHH